MKFETKIKIDTTQKNNDLSLDDLRKRYPNNLTLGYININSVRSKLDNLSQYINGTLNILAIAETKIDSSFPTSQFLIKGMKKPYRLDISDKSGGLLVYVDINITSFQIKPKTVTDKNFQAIFVEVRLQKQIYVLVCIYRPPKVDILNFLNSLTEVLDELSKKYSRVIIMGDFNESPDHECIKQFLNIFQLKNLIKENTCFKTQRGTCIDLILSNCPMSHQYSKTFETGLSDFHKMIYTMLKCKFIKLPPKVSVSRDFRHFDENKFKKEVTDKIENKISNFSEFNFVLEEIVDKHAPYKRKILRGNTKPHMNKPLRKEIMKRSRLKNRYNNTKLEVDLIAYKKQRNLVVNMNRRSKTEYLKNNNPKDKTSRNFWNFCKPYFSDKNIIVDDRIKLRSGDSILINDLEIAQKMNDFFINCTEYLDITKWKSNSQSCNKFDTHPSILEIEKQDFDEKNCFKGVKVEEVYSILNSLDIKKKVSGNIPNVLLKLLKNEIVQPLTSCINRSINEGVFPAEHKIAEVTPVFKKNDPLNVENYRPISILPSISKVYEKVLKKQLEEFFENKLSPILCGFRKGHSTQHALLRLLQNCQKALDKGEKVGMVLMDLSKAYDCIPHDLLIAKLNSYGLDKNSLKLLSSYLSNRRQKVKIGSLFSELVEILKGLPQGSVLAPLLFNIFINDLMISYKKNLLCNFADDNTIVSNGVNLSEIKNNLQEGLDVTIKWFELNSMKANPDKFQFIILNRNGKSIDTELNVGKIAIKNKDSVKLLGVIIDKQLLFKNHINAICEKGEKRLLALMRVRKFLDEKQTSVLANSYILSAFKYCNLTWMFCPKKENYRINALHKRMLRCIYNSSEDFQEMLIKYKMTDIHTQNIQSLMLFIFKVIKGDCPDICSDFFKIKESTYSLRNKFRLELPGCNSNKYGINTIFFKGSLLWNQVPNELKLLNNAHAFKTQIKKWKPKECTWKICS